MVESGPGSRSANHWPSGFDCVPATESPAPAPAAEWAQPHPRSTPPTTAGSDRWLRETPRAAHRSWMTHPRCFDVRTGPGAGPARNHHRTPRTRTSRTQASRTQRSANPRNRRRPDRRRCRKSRCCRFRKWTTTTRTRPTSKHRRSSQSRPIQPRSPRLNLTRPNLTRTGPTKPVARLPKSRARPGVVPTRGAFEAALPGGRQIPAALSYLEKLDLLVPKQFVDDVDVTTSQLLQLLLRS